MWARVCAHARVRVVGWEEGGIKGLAFTRAPRVLRAPNQAFNHFDTRRGGTRGCRTYAIHPSCKPHNTAEPRGAAWAPSPEPRSSYSTPVPSQEPTGRREVLRVPAEGPLGPPHEERAAVAEGTAAWPLTPRLTHREDGPLLRWLVAVLEEAVTVGGRGGVPVILLLGRGGTGRRKGNKRGKRRST